MDLHPIPPAVSQASHDVLQSLHFPTSKMGDLPHLAVVRIYKIAHINGLAQLLMWDKCCKIDIYDFNILNGSEVLSFKIAQIPGESLMQVYIKAYPFKTGI